MKKMVIMRGVPGSGKTHRANEIHEAALRDGLTAEIYSTDNYFMVNGVYRYDAAKIGLYHSLNQQAVSDAIREGIDVIIVDNTNVKSKDFLYYLEAGVLNDLEVAFGEPTSPWWLAARPRLGTHCDKTAKELTPVFASRNNHGVDETVIARMLVRWENEDGFCDAAKQLLEMARS